MYELLNLLHILKPVNGTIFLETKNGYALETLLRKYYYKINVTNAYLAALVSSKKNFNSESLTRNGILQGTVSMIELLGL